MMQATTSKLDEALAFLRDVVGPQAAELDQNPAVVRSILKQMGDRELLSLKRPIAYGGPEISESEFRQFQEEIARRSGTLAFLQTQHQSAASMLARSENEELKQRYLPFMANGSKMVGIGFSQLRRGGDPIMKARPVPGGYVLSGHVPWVTGWDYYGEFLIGATLPDGQALFAVVPLVDGSGVKVSAPMKLAAMEAAHTVTVDFFDYSISDDDVAFIMPTNWIANSDMVNIALQGHFAIGCSLGSLDVLAENALRKKLPFLNEQHRLLAEELEECRAATAEAQRLSGEETTAERLAVRAWAVDMAFRCAQAAVVSSSGAANSLAHPAQRLYREALVYSVSAQTLPIMEATLRRITHS